MTGWPKRRGKKGSSRKTCVIKSPFQQDRGYVSLPGVANAGIELPAPEVEAERAVRDMLEVNLIGCL